MHHIEDRALIEILVVAIVGTGSGCDHHGREENN
jgi:hypothetical protein